jgi:uncharacterized protein (DUF1778 family)
MNRSLWLKLRVTREEKAAVEFAAAESGVSLSDFVRQRLLGARVRQTAEEREIIRQLARIGANMNQLARWANTHKGHAEAIEVILCLDRLRGDLKAIEGATPCT